jgi:hypothetical protein
MLLRSTALLSAALPAWTDPSAHRAVFVGVDAQTALELRHDLQP